MYKYATNIYWAEGRHLFALYLHRSNLLHKAEIKISYEDIFVQYSVNIYPLEYIYCDYGMITLFDYEITIAKYGHWCTYREIYKWRNIRNHR